MSTYNQLIHKYKKELKDKGLSLEVGKAFLFELCNENCLSCYSFGFTLSNQKCVECMVNDPENPPKRCINDVNGVAHIQVCNGNTYEDELIAEDSENPDSAKIPNISPEGNSCKQNELAFGECNNLAGQICKNETDGDGWEIGMLHTCKDGVIVDSMCMDSEDNTNEVSCNADKTACGICKNKVSKKCQNNEYGVGIMTKCVNGEWQDVKCGRDLGCHVDPSMKNYCKSCIYNAIINNNEMQCVPSRNTMIMVCDENGSWVSKECKASSDDPYNKTCQTGVSQFHDFCPGGY